MPLARDNAAFGASPQTPGAAMAKCAPLLREAGLEIVDAQKWDGRLRFADMGAVVYYLKAIPWEVPGFGVRSRISAV